MCTVPARTPLEEQLVREALAMASYALASGKTLPVEVVEVLQCSLIASAQFATSVASCTDRCAEVGALSWRTQSSHGSLLPRPRAPSCCWPSSLEAAVAGASSVRYVWCAACWCWRWHRWWVCWAFGATEYVTPLGTHPADLVGLSSLINAAFLLCAASIGASFSALFRINLYIAATTYDPKHDVSYWVQYGLGLIAGVLLATMVPVTSGSGAVLTRPALALVGGFSASLLYRILDRISRSIESMVVGEAGSAGLAGTAAEPGRAALPPRTLISRQLPHPRARLPRAADPDGLRLARLGRRDHRLGNMPLSSPATLGGPQWLKGRRTLALIARPLCWN